MSLPKPLRTPLALLSLLATVAAGTAGVVSYVKALAQEKVDAAMAPTQVWQKGADQRLERIEHKLDRLLEKK